MNVLIDRLPRKETVRGRSCCENCRTPLLWVDLIPLFSFLFLKGRCRYCDEKIPLRLPLVELLTGVGFAAITVHVLGNSLPPFTTLYNAFPLRKEWLSIVKYSKVLFLLFVYCSFLVLFFTDFEYGVLPDAIILPASVVALVWRLLGLRGVVLSFTTLFNTLHSLAYGLSAVLAPPLSLAGFFLLLILITRGRGMGFGDVKLGFLMGLVLGWPGTVVAAFLAFLFGGVVSVILLSGGWKKFGEAVPFGPFLITGTAVAAVYGSVIWEWYVGML